jgi:predicted negative regulator of RcsB-dependent stress response
MCRKMAGLCYDPRAASRSWHFDVLVKQGNAKEALERYDEALQSAPTLKMINEARDAAKRKI